MDKPRDWTSHDVVARVRRLANLKRVGHAGTLDPMATGVLVVLLGRATRLADVVQTGQKRYRATVTLGIATDSDDAEGSEIARAPVPEITAARVEEALVQFRGDILQKPPAYAAIKVGGQRAYARARRGEAVDLAPRTVSIGDLTLVACDASTVTIDITCSKGTYIRALGRDLAQGLGTVGHLTELRRTAVGPFTIDEAWTLEALALDGPDAALQSVTRALPSVPTLTVSHTDAARLRNGQPVPRPDGAADVQANGGAVWVIDAAAQPVCLGRLQDQQVWPRLVL
ncbi:MAG: tRNA pseudouridine(55) synthase TruB [Chloroflexota bacterium]